MKICVLQPSYEGASIDYASYDPPRDLTGLLPGHEVDHVFLKKATTHRQIRELKRKGYDVYVNLCDGLLDWEVPSIDVITALERFNLPYTGPTEQLYDPPKELMKLVAHSEGVRSPRYALIEDLEDLEQALEEIPFPIFVKPHAAGDSLGIDRDSLVRSREELERKVRGVLEHHEKVLIEEYIAGREFTVLVCANPLDARRPFAYKPLEFVFPEGESFKTYDLKVRQHRPECNVACDDDELAERLKEAARRVFVGFSGVGYARSDMRLSGDGEIYFLEINFACSIFYPEGAEGSADYILKFDGTGQSQFLDRIIGEALARHREKQKSYEVRPNAVSGYGIYAKREILKGETIFPGEERPQRIVSRSHVNGRWDEPSIEQFNRYAYAISREVYILWDREPGSWAPQNHSCDPNTEFHGLDVRARRDIGKGEELTLDYSTFYDENMIEFECHCGSPLCRKVISGQRFNIISSKV